MGNTVLVTGVSRHLGARVARSLAAHPDVGHVIGLDVIPPVEQLGRADFVRADVRNPVVGRLLEQEKVRTVIHLALSTFAAHGRERASQKEANVIGTMQLLAACQSSRHLRRVVLKSTCEVYGSSPRDPAMFAEDAVRPGARVHGAIRDAQEVEGYLRATSRRRPDLETTTLRMAHVIGPRVESELLDYLALPVVPVPFGYDARLQFLHEDDAVAAIVAATVGPAAGVVNVAGEGILTLTQAVALAGRAMLPMPTNTGRAFGRLGRLTRVNPLADADVDYLMYGRVMDTTRMRERLGFRPSRTTREAFIDALAGLPAPLTVVTSALSWAGALGTAVASSVAGAATPTRSIAWPEEEAEDVTDDDALDLADVLECEVEDHLPADVAVPVAPPRVDRPASRRPRSRKAVLP